MNPLEQFFESGQTIPWIETLNAVAFLGPILDTDFRTPGPAFRLAEFLRICQIHFALTQRFFRSHVVRDVSHRAHEFGAAPLICRGATDDLEVLNRSIRHQQSMFQEANSVLSPEACSISC